MVAFTNGVWDGVPQQGGHVTFACPFWNGGVAFTCRVEDVILPDGGLIEVVDDDGKVIVPVVEVRHGNQDANDDHDGGPDGRVGVESAERAGDPLEA